MNKNSKSAQYRSLTDIRAQKDLLKKDIEQQDEKISLLWGILFHQEKSERLLPRPTKKIGGMIKVGTGLMDGALLGWKLYRKFNGKGLIKLKK